MNHGHGGSGSGRAVQGHGTKNRPMVQGTTTIHAPRDGAGSSGQARTGHPPDIRPHSQRHIPWQPHMPPFLLSNDPFVKYPYVPKTILISKRRLGTVDCFLSEVMVMWSMDFIQLCRCFGQSTDTSWCHIPLPRTLCASSCAALDCMTAQLTSNSKKTDSLRHQSCTRRFGTPHRRIGRRSSHYGSPTRRSLRRGLRPVPGSSTRSPHHPSCMRRCSTHRRRHCLPAKVLRSRVRIQ
mmetsp:Transcript_1739/g.5722  ORF Transcript_1739/g.5722 Transcript_1739/m.5722 type:complete len:237 (+) Transcript_1739:107-817(+)